MDGNSARVPGEKVLIFLLGGTSETAPLARALADSGYGVLVSTATDNELEVGTHPNIRRRQGRMDATAMAALLKEEKAKAVVDATHPYAVEAKKTARSAAGECGLPYFPFTREAEEYDYENIIRADDHEEAARKAFAVGKPVLLTTGSRNLAPYVKEHKASGVPLVARVLPHAESESACREAGLAPRQVIAQRGPFTVEQNVRLIKERSIGVLVSKDSGRAGGVPDKLESARLTGCVAVLIKRPETPSGYLDVGSLVKDVKEAVG